MLFSCVPFLISFLPGVTANHLKTWQLKKERKNNIDITSIQLSPNWVGSNLLSIVRDFDSLNIFVKLTFKLNNIVFSKQSQDSVNLNSFKLSKSSKPKIISRNYSVSILLLFFPEEWQGHHHLDKFFHLFVGNDETKILYFLTFHQTALQYQIIYSD